MAYYTTRLTLSEWMLPDVLVVLLVLCLVEADTYGRNEGEIYARGDGDKVLRVSRRPRMKAKQRETRSGQGGEGSSPSVDP